MDGKKNEKPPFRGRCEMCGKDGANLYMFFLGDYAGYTCVECIGEMQSCITRRFIGTAEGTEPAE